MLAYSSIAQISHMVLGMGFESVLGLTATLVHVFDHTLLPWEIDHWPYDTTHVLAQLQLLFFSALAFVWLTRQGPYPPALHPVNIDAEWLYRKLLPNSTRALAGSIPGVSHDVADAAVRSLLPCQNAR